MFYFKYVDIWKGRIKSYHVPLYFKTCRLIRDYFGRAIYINASTLQRGEPGGRAIAARNLVYQALAV